MVLVWKQAFAAGRVTVLAVIAACVCGQAAEAQDVTGGLTVIPVSFELSPGRMTAVLTIQNHTGREAAFQVRPYAWDQSGGPDRLTPTDALVVSPPLGKVPIGGQQVVRLVLRQPARGQETTYRILLDEVPPPAQPGLVNFTLRLSIPVFVEPTARETAHVRWSVQHDGDAFYLVAVNGGGRHEVFRDMALTAGGRPIRLEQNISPYVLPGATRRWRILSTDAQALREALRLKAQSDTGPVDQLVSAPSADR
jgi:fimbrial chaperone protein